MHESAQRGMKQIMQLVRTRHQTIATNPTFFVCKVPVSYLQVGHLLWFPFFFFLSITITSSGELGGLERLLCDCLGGEGLL